MSLNRLFVTICILAALGLTGPVRAESTSNPMILLHLSAPTTKGVCSHTEARPDCSHLITKGALFPSKYIAYVLAEGAIGGSGIAGVQFGISYKARLNQGVDVFEWKLCGSLDFQSSTWPDSGSGNTVLWDPTVVCRGTSDSNPILVAGYFYCTAYSPDALTVIPHPGPGKATVLLCGQNVEASERAVPSSDLGSACFSVDGTMPGYSPCTGTTTTASSTVQSILGPSLSVKASQGAITAQIVFDFSLPVPGPISLRVYDVSGRLVREIASGLFSEGEHEVRWDKTGEEGSAIAEGVYFYRLRTQNGSLNGRLVLAK